MTVRYRYARLVLASSMLIMGACGIVYEYTLGVLGNNLIGSSHEQVFVIIGIMMFAMGLGAGGQKLISGRLIDKFLWIEWLLGLAGGISTVVILAAFAATASYQVVLYGFALAIGILIGLEIPLLIRINTEYEHSLKANLSSILAMDYVGALIGALLFAYVLLTSMSVVRIAALLGIVNTALAGAGLWYFRGLVVRRRTLTVAVAASIGILVPIFVAGDDWAGRLEQRAYPDPIIHSSTSVYQHVVVTKRDDRLSLHINGKLQFSSEDEAIYHDLLTHLPMALAERRTTVLILGGGDGLALREVLRYPDVKSVTLVDLDPEVVRLAVEQPDLVKLNRAAFHDARVHVQRADGLVPGETITVAKPGHLPDARGGPGEVDLAEVRVVHIDADVFLREIRGRYDIALLDFPDPHSLEVAKLYSVEFYRQLAQRLAPRAFVAVQSTSPFFAKQAFLCIGVTLRAAGFHALPYHDNVPSFGEWGFHLAWRHDEAPEAVRRRLDRVDALPVASPYATPDVLRAAFVFGRGWLRSDAEIRANTKLSPVLPRYYRESRWR